MVKDNEFSDDAMQQSRYSDIHAKRPPAAPKAATFTVTAASSSSSLSRKRKPETMEVDEGPSIRADMQSSKQVRGRSVSSLASVTVN
jgi:hypothetical protein